MNCPRCGALIRDAQASRCPWCSEPLAHTEQPGEAAPTAPGGASAAEGVSGQYPSAASDALYETRPPTLPRPRPRPPTDYASSIQPNWGMPVAPPAQPQRSLARARSTLGRTLSIGFGVIILAVVLFRLFGPHSGYTAYPGTPPDETVIFQDDLTSNTHQWAEDPHCFFQDGGYYITGYICFAPSGSNSDVNISVQVEQVVGPVYGIYGIAFRHTSGDNYYLFYLDGNGHWGFGKSLDGAAYLSDIVPERPDRAIQGGPHMVNTLLVRAKGSHFVFFINAQEVGQADDSSFSQGQTGLGTDPQTEALFTHFQITTSS